MAAENPSCCKIESFDGAVFAECLQSVSGAGRSETACRGFERGDAHLIETDEHHEREYCDFLECRQESTLTH